jgi:hypothetical protein
MFSNEDLKCLDPEYFSIITTDAYDVTIMLHNASSNGHFCGVKRTRSEAGGRQLNCSWLPLPEPFERSRMLRTSLVLDLSNDSGTITSQAVCDCPFIAQSVR